VLQRPHLVSTAQALRGRIDQTQGDWTDVLDIIIGNYPLVMVSSQPKAATYGHVTVSSLERRD